MMDINFIQLQCHGDERGSLVALEEHKNIPFTIKRIYYLFDTKQKVRRGFHAHKKLRQIAVVVKGSCSVLFDDGSEKKEIILDNPSKGLIIEPYMWHEMFDFSEDCIFLVLADDIYDESDYIRNYTSFLEMVGQNF